jgi:hypothetical protein
MNKEIDWMGRWYDIIKDRGENDRPTLGRLDLRTNEVDWMEFSHSEMDGVGALIHYYEKTDFKLEKYPSLREASIPSFFERLLIFYRLIFTSTKIKTIWNETNRGAEPKDPLAISYRIFTKEETGAIETFCKKNKYSVNAFLMNTTTKFLLSLLSKNGEGTWTLPVNLRPVLKRKNIKSNHSSAILISVAKNDSPLDTHQRISLALKNKMHWGIWWMHQIGKFIGYTGMKYISGRAAKTNFVIGSFSNLSSWELPPHHIWVGGPPGSKNFPISVMVMKANDQMSFSLKIHPFIMKDLSRTSEILNKLIQHILQEVD